MFLHNILRLYIDRHVSGVFFRTSALSFGSGTDGWNPLKARIRTSPVEKIVNMKAEKATGEYNLLIREVFYSHDMMPMTSHGQPSVVPKAELNAHGYYEQPPRAFK